MDLYEKTDQVITSCRTLEQLDVARKYRELAFKQIKKSDHWRLECRAITIYQLITLTAKLIPKSNTPVD